MSLCQQTGYYDYGVIGRQPNPVEFIIQHFTSPRPPVEDPLLPLLNVKHANPLPPHAVPRR